MPWFPNDIFWVIVVLLFWLAWDWVVLELEEVLACCWRRKSVTFTGWGTKLTGLLFLFRICAWIDKIWEIWSWDNPELRSYVMFKPFTEDAPPLLLLLFPNETVVVYW